MSIASNINFVLTFLKIDCEVSIPSSTEYRVKHTYCRAYIQDIEEFLSEHSLDFSDK